MEHENENVSKHNFHKCIVKIAYDNMLLELGTFIQIHEKYKCNAYKLKGEHEFMKININNLVTKRFASIYELKGDHELMEISPDNLVNKSFEGSCIVEVYDDYYNSCKSTILFVQ